MKYISLLIWLLASWAVSAQEIPQRSRPPKLVNDFANMLIPEQRQALESKLVAYDDSTSTQITIVTVPNLGGYEPEVFATELGERWGVGGAQFDNGIVILVSLGNDQEKRKAFIAVGRGLEGAIPDLTAGQIYEDIMVPSLRTGDYYGAFDKATSALIQAAAGEYKAPENYRKRGKSGGLSAGKVIFALIIFSILISMFGGGNRGGGYMSRRGYRGFMGPTIFPTGGLGGGWSGGGGGGGGFGGFGGGSFGGGGAGGDW